MKKKNKKFNKFEIKHSNVRMGLARSNISQSFGDQDGCGTNAPHFDFEVRRGEWNWSFTLHEGPYPVYIPIEEPTFSLWRLSFHSSRQPEINVGECTVTGADFVADVAWLFSDCICQSTDSSEYVPSVETFAGTIQRHNLGILAELHESFRPHITYSSDQDGKVYEIVLEGIYTPEGVDRFHVQHILN